MLHLFYNSHPIDRNSLKHESLYILTLKLHWAVTTRKSQLFIIEAEITSNTSSFFRTGMGCSIGCCGLFLCCMGVFRVLH